MKRLLLNTSIFQQIKIESFAVDSYQFVATKKTQHGLNFKNSHVEFSGNQKNSIIFKGGVCGNRHNPIKRKFLEDILLIGSLLDGSNWELYSNRKRKGAPLFSNPYLDFIWNNNNANKNMVEKYFQTAIVQISDDSWQTQFENGFHLLMLKNHANITNEESRFLSYFVIWEWLYPHLKNPEGAKVDDESNNFHEIFNYIMKYIWRSYQNIENNIFRHLRNQLTHSGKLPIDRNYKNPKYNPEEWMKNLDHHNITKYISFFERLTQVIVLKTIGINADHIIQFELDNFLQNGDLKVSSPR